MSETETQRSATELMGWLWRRYLDRQKGLLLITVVMMALEGSTLGLFSYMMQPMFDRVFIEGETGAIASVAAMIVFVFGMRAISSMARRVLLARVKERAAADIRTDLTHHLLTLDLGFFANKPPGYMIERVQGDVQQIASVWSNVLLSIARDGVSLIWLLGIALWIDWKWALIAFAGVPLLILPIRAAQKYVRRKAKTSREIAGQSATRLDEMFHGLMPIKLNGLERYQTDKFAALASKRVKAEVKTAMGQASIYGLVDVVAGLGFLAVLFFGGSDIISGEKTVGQFMSFFTAMAVAFEPLRSIGGVSGQIQAATASIERVHDLFEAEPAIVSPAEPKRLPAGAPEIRLEDVHLAYGETPVLRGVSFTAPAGKTTALVGASGAGKSTVFNVLARLFDPDSGVITLADIPNDALSLSELRNQFSIVTQDPALFDESLRENILLGRSDVSEAELKRALDAASVSEFLPKLPQGLDTQVGPRGSNLSGGQRQRVAIARAILRDTPVLLLDEATSALDSRSETAIQQALETLSLGRTTLVIAHRLATIRDADKIVVMDHGRVVGEGTHDALLAEGGLYADLHALQFKDTAA